MKRGRGGLEELVGGGGDMHAFENSERVWLLFEQQVRSLRGIKRRTASSYMRTAPYPLYIGSGTF